MVCCMCVYIYVLMPTYIHTYILEVCVYVHTGSVCVCMHAVPTWDVRDFESLTSAPSVGVTFHDDDDVCGCMHACSVCGCMQCVWMHACMKRVCVHMNAVPICRRSGL